MSFWKLIISYNDRKVISNYDNATKKKSIPTVMFYKAYNSKSSNHKHLLIKWSNFNRFTLDNTIIRQQPDTKNNYDKKRWMWFRTQYLYLYFSTVYWLTGHKKKPIKTNLLTGQELLSIPELLCALNFAHFKCIFLVFIPNDFVALCSHNVDNIIKYFIMFFFFSWANFF